MSKSGPTAQGRAQGNWLGPWTRLGFHLTAILMSMMTGCALGSYWGEGGALQSGALSLLLLERAA